MKRGKGKAAKRKAGTEAATAFARGFVTTGLLSMFQDRLEPVSPAPSGRKILRHALQGGAALSAATMVAEALRQRDYPTVLTAAALGAGGVLAAEYLLTHGSSERNEETGFGQEKEEI
ncbi:hypothetical protein [Magnetospirillum molischianum]|uniref:Uncharacterized protein n=1 Tax=Magnetospirillum molischianum DSM 120 TaxID=1150626 RepID=H8FTT0_MAGML|nr:hypothetical protein [Magnetospirillum molischianum]CCG41787.1 conserved hypothetical protein [Magnetospirillum molischianum DSM 120]